MNFFIHNKNLILSFFSNREWAIIVLLFLFIIYCIFDKNVRPFLNHLIKCFFVRRILIMMLISNLYIFICVLILRICGWWDFFLLKDTALYMIITSFLINIKMINVERHHPFQEVFKDQLKMVNIILFIYNLFCFDFLIEMILILVVLLLRVLVKVASKSEDFNGQRTSKFLQYILYFFYAILFVFLIHYLFYNFDNVFNHNVLKSFLLPLVLSLLYLPYLFCLSVYSSYTAWFSHIRAYSNDNRNLYLYRRNAVIKHCMFNLKMIKYVSKHFHTYANQTNQSFVENLKTSISKFNIENNLGIQ